MPASPANGADRIQLLLDHLGYTSETGWIAATDFGGLATHRFAMQQAEREMSVIGAVCPQASMMLRGCSFTPPIIPRLSPANSGHCATAGADGRPLRSVRHPSKDISVLA